MAEAKAIGEQGEAGGKTGGNDVSKIVVHRIWALISFRLIAGAQVRVLTCNPWNFANEWNGCCILACWYLFWPQRRS